MSTKKIEAKAAELMELRRMKEELDAEIEAAQDAIKAAMGDAESITAGMFRISYKAVTTSRIDTKGIKAAHPDIAAAFTVTTTTRRFTIS